MGKRDALLKRNTVNMLSEAANTSNNIIDTIVEDMQESMPAPEQVENKEEQKKITPVSQAKQVMAPVKEKAKPANKNVDCDSLKINSNFTFEKKVKQRKTVHKNFLITEELNQKYVALAARTGLNENELFASILNQIFNS